MLGDLLDAWFKLETFIGSNIIQKYLHIDVLYTKTETMNCMCFTNKVADF